MLGISQTNIQHPISNLQIVIANGNQQTNYNTKEANHLNKCGNDKHGGLNPSACFGLPGHSFHCLAADASDTETRAYRYDACTNTGSHEGYPCV